MVKIFTFLGNDFLVDYRDVLLIFYKLHIIYVAASLIWEKDFVFGIFYIFYFNPLQISMNQNLKEI